MKRIALLAALVGVSLAGCAAMPTEQEIASLDYGQPISRDDAVALVKERTYGSLKDPYSAVYECGQVRQQWLKGHTALGGGLVAGYGINCSINAKNSYGGYAGGKEFLFLIHNGSVVRMMSVMPDGSLMPSGYF